MNQYRCETCDFKGKGMMGDERCPYDVQKTNEDHCDLLYRFKRTTEERELMELCGLTCHSDFKSLPELNKEFNRMTIGYMGELIKENQEKEQAIQQMVREKIAESLKDFDMWFSARHVCGQSPIIPEVRQELHRRMRELKQETKQEDM